MKIAKVRIYIIFALNWLVVYHDSKDGSWTIATGIIESLKELGVDILEFTFENPNNFKLPESKFFEENQIKVVLSFYAGKSKCLENELKRLKSELSIFLISELGDEPQTLIHNNIRAKISDISLSPDRRSSLYWRNQGYNCIWFNHWVDTNYFYQIPKFKKTNFIVTTMGKRKYDRFLKFLLGKKFLNKRCKDDENAYFFNSGKVVFQYARWNEITRRLFEGAACNCCILTNKLPEHTGIETIFAHNVSALYFRGPFDLIYQILRLILKPDLINLISKNANHIVMNNHTQKNRAKTLIEEVSKLY